MHSGKLGSMAKKPQARPAKPRAGGNDAKSGGSVSGGTVKIVNGGNVNNGKSAKSSVKSKAGRRKTASDAHDITVGHVVKAATDGVPPALDHLKKADSVMAAIIERVGPFTLQYREPIFQTLVRSIVYQQLNGKAALTIFNRLMDAAKADPLTPASILKLRPAKMRALGLSAQKLSYIRELARLTKSGDVDFEAVGVMEDVAVIDHLTKVKGIGVWTAHMFLIFALRRPDVLPTGDLGVRAAIKKAYGLAELPKPVDMERIAAAWRPYCSVACWYLWRSLENQGAM
jgi:DNA-3-methyladenine glycosylase II